MSRMVFAAKIFVLASWIFMLYIAIPDGTIIRGFEQNRLDISEIKKN